MGQISGDVQSARDGEHKTDPCHPRMRLAGLDFAQVANGAGEQERGEKTADQLDDELGHQEAKG